jgi:hypothetical protein
MSATFNEYMSKIKDAIKEEERKLSNGLFSGSSYLHLFLTCLTL